MLQTWKGRNFHMGFWWVNLKERDRLEDLVVDEVTKINLKQYEKFWIGFIYVGGLISFTSTVIFLFTLDISG